MGKRPNVLFLMADHANAAALAPGSQCLKPRLDALAAQGRRFGRFHTTNAICSPARASLMTGLYPSQHGMWDCVHTQRREWLDVPASRFRYFSQVLAAAGYRNGYRGKWHVEQSRRLEDFGWHEYDIDCGHVRAEIRRLARVAVVETGQDFAGGGPRRATDRTSLSCAILRRKGGAQAPADQPAAGVLSARESG